MFPRYSRRTLFASTAAFLASARAAVAARTEQTVKFLERSFFQRVLGQCATAEPKDAGCWSYAKGEVHLDLGRAPELSRPGSAVRLEGKGLPRRVLVVYGEDHQYHAVSNACTHAGRRLDPVPGTATVQCCSVNKSTFNYDGRSIYGPGKKAIQPFTVSLADHRLTIAGV